MKFQNPFRSKAAQQQAATSDANRQDKQALQEFHAGRVGALDRCGRQIHLHDDVLYEPANTLVYKVVAATPVIDRNMPRGVVQLTLVCTVPVNCLGNQPSFPLTVVARNGRFLVPETTPDAPEAPTAVVEDPAKRLILP